MKLLKSAFTILTIFASLNATRAAVISGIMRDANTKERLISANVVVLNTPYGASTDLDGKYTIILVPPTSPHIRYTVAATMLGYEEMQATNVAIIEGTIVNLDFDLVPTAINLKEIEIETVAEKGTEERELQERLTSTTITDALTSETMRGLPDPDIASVVRRTTGVSTMGGEPVIRGLGIRYSKVTLNGAYLAGTEPNRSAVSLELFPASLMRQVTVSKSFLPDQFGEFGGGVVDMNTIEFVGEPEFNVSLSSSYNSLTTFKDFKSYHGGSTDFLGFDDGTRAMPAVIESADKISTSLPSHTLEIYGESFENNWDPFWTYAGPNQSYSVSLSNETRFLGRRISYITSGLYRNKFSTVHTNIRSYEAGSPGVLETKIDYLADDYTHSITLGGVGALSWELSPLHVIGLTTMYSRKTDDQTRYYEGLFEADENVFVKWTRFRYVGESIWINQLIGTHAFPQFLKSNLRWRLTYSRGIRYEPDTRAISYWADAGDTLNNYVAQLEGKSVKSTDSGSHLFGNLWDDTWHAGVDYTIRPIKSNDNFKLKVGADFLDRYRNSEIRFLRYYAEPGFPVEYLTLSTPSQLFTPQMIEPGIMHLEDRTDTQDDYEAFQDLWAAYAMLDVPITKRLQLTGGARIESSDQKVVSFEEFNPDEVPASSGISTTDILPGGTLVYSFNEKSKIRLAASQTVNRPDFREMSKYVFNEWEGGYGIAGNDTLKRSLIQHYDLRYEWVHGKANIVSASLFYKYFDKPIEMVQVTYSGKILVPINAISAYNYGAELEFRQNLGELWWILSPFAVSTNLTLLKSDVKINPNSPLISTKSNRPLQGQSPYLFNFNLNYTNPWSETEVDMLFNIFGKRIYAVGSADLPEIYEMPHPELDFTFSHRLSRTVTLKGSVENVIDPEIRFQHDTSEYQGNPDYFTEKYRKGRTFSLGLAYNP